MGVVLMSKRVLKWDVPVNDQYHYIGSGQVAHVQCQRETAVVQVWTVEKDVIEPGRLVRVFGTGQEVPDSLVFLGTTMPNPHLVWHVFGEETNGQGTAAAQDSGDALQA
jgi:hypothetical protein